MPKFGSVPISVLANQLMANFWTNFPSHGPGGSMPRTWGNPDPETPTEITVNVEALGSDQQDQARLALQLWQDVANIHVTYIVGDDADITYIDDPKPDGKAEASTYLFVGRHGQMIDAVVDVSRNYGVGPGKGHWNNFFQAMLHETGHALGLGHSGNYNGGKENEYYNTKATLYANDTWQNSVMSYNDQAQHGGASRDNVMTPQMADIYAIQQMYGAATTRSEDSVYGFNCNIIDPDTDPDAKYHSIYDLAQYNVRRLGYHAPAFTIYDSAGNDTLDASRYKVDQAIDLRSGHFSSIGGYEDNVGIYKSVIVENAVGGSGNDVITGNAAVNHLFGGDGNDTLDGGAGGDSMVGGMGDDTYIVDNVGDDTVEFDDVGSGTDTVRTNLTFYRLDYNVENLIYTSDQAFSGIGNELNNSITGGIGDDFLQGNEGNDTLISDGGRDSMIGGSGDDIYVIGGGAEIIVEDYNGGIDEIQTAGSGYTLGFNVENLRFIETHVFRRRGTGNELDNHIYGASYRDRLSGLSGNDTLYGYGGFDQLSGGDGNDTLRGGAASDILDGGDGSDTADYRDANAKTKINLADGTGDVLRSDGTESDSLISIENVIASTRDDFIVGDNQNNTFTYAGYYQSLSASGGVDKYFGGLGSDTVDFSIFAVQLLEVDLRAGTATAKYSVDGPHGTKNGVKVIAQLSGIENVVANTRNTTIIGDDENNTFTYVGAFGDQVDKGGRDDYDGGKGSDTVDLSRLAAQMVRLDLGVGDVEASYHIGLPDDSVLAGSAVVAHISNIENVVASFGDDTLSGDSNDNTFSYVGGFFFDVNNASYDTYAGNDGIDTVDFSRFYGNAVVDLSTGDMSSSYTVLFPNGETSSGSMVLGRISGIENIIAGTYDDTLTGDDQNNTFFYAGSIALEDHIGGFDTYDGGGGTNTVDLSKATATLGAIIDLDKGKLSSRGYDGFGNPHSNDYATLKNIQNAVGTSLRDTFQGSAEANVFSGRNGDDRLIGAGGDDLLTGGYGKDTFVFDVGFGKDVISDFRASNNLRFGISHDVIQFSKALFVDWDHVLALMSDSDAGAVIALETGDAITLTGVTRQQLIDHHAVDFTFV